MTAESLNLFAYLRALIERLMFDARYNRVEAERVIHSVQATLGDIGAEYEGTPPEGLEAIYSLMRESVELFDLSCQQILAFVATDNEEYLMGALAQAEEADDVLMMVTDLVSEQKSHLEAMAEAY